MKTPARPLPQGFIKDKQNPCGANRKNDQGPCPSIRVSEKNGRCLYHGGASTGARTPEGKARSLAAMQQGNRCWVARRAGNSTDRKE